jgi:hypothetical protein
MVGTKHRFVALKAFSLWKRKTFPSKFEQSFDMVFCSANQDHNAKTNWNTERRDELQNFFHSKIKGTLHIALLSPTDKSQTGALSVQR